MHHALSVITHIVSVGSVDGVCTSAALLRLIGNPETSLQFTQAFTVDKIDPTQWADGQKVAFVDLAVNNRNTSMTAAFVRRIHNAGHQIVAIIDEHNREDWLEVLGTFEGLIIEPQSQSAGEYTSSGAILKVAIGSHPDTQTLELLDAADAGDRMDFSTRLGGMVNQAVKSAIWDDSRRVHLARHLATGATEPDQQIEGWIGEYREILSNHAQIMAQKEDLGDGIVRVVAMRMKVDVTTLMRSLYQSGARIVLLQGIAFNPMVQDKTVQISIGTNDPSIDLMKIMRLSGVTPIGGFAKKVNVYPSDEQKAIEAIRDHLKRMGQLYEASGDAEFSGLRVGEERIVGGRRYKGYMPMAPSSGGSGDYAQYAEDIGLA